MATEQAQTQTPTTPEADGPAEVPERDYAKLLVTDDAPAEVEELPPEAEAEKVETPAEPVTPEAEAKETEKAPTPGTPDKVLQQMQQDLSAATRQLAALTEKQAAGEKLTPKEQAKVETATRKLEVIRRGLKEKGSQFDILDDGMGEATAETLDELDRSDAELREENRKLAARLERIEQATAAQQQAAQWQATEAKYPGVNVRDIWDKAASDAIEASGFTAEEINADPRLSKAITNVASRTFHDRADAATKSKQAKQPVAPPPDKKPTATRNAPPVTPGGARVAQSSGVSTTSEPDEFAKYRNNARALVTD